MNRPTEAHLTPLVLYRLPDEPHCHILEGDAASVRTLPDVSAVGANPGFVMVPFAPSSACPIVLFTPRSIRTVAISQLEADPFDAGDVCTADGNTDCYAADFHHFHDAILSGQFSKLVLSRSLSVRFTRTIHPISLFRHACTSYPHQYVAYIRLPQCGSWLMATPELLLSGNDGEWHTMSLAGTRRAEHTSDRPWSEKNLREQRMVTDYIAALLQRVAQNCIVEGPDTVTAAHLQHLRTMFRFTLHDNRHIGTLLQQLYPTPAVCGMPKEAARNYIMQHESTDRRYYSGFCGMVSPHGATHLYVSLRCMQLHTNGATLYAGGGIIAESEMQSEWNETEAKLQTMYRLLTP